MIPCCRHFLLGFLFLVPLLSFTIAPQGRKSSVGKYGLMKPLMAQISEKEARAGIDKVVNALRKSADAKKELGNCVKVNNILGYGSPKQGELAVRFNASFQKSGFGRSAVPMPFMLGQTDKSEGRGTMVGQVKASIDLKTGKILSCSVFKDLGYGNSFNLKL
jgi:hypothetical protein